MGDEPLKSVSIPDYVAIEREERRIALREFRRTHSDDGHIELYDAIPQAQRDLLTSIKSAGELKVDIRETDTLEHAQALEALELVRSTVNATARSRAYHLTELGRKFLYMNGL